MPFRIQILEIVSVFLFALSTTTASAQVLPTYEGVYLDTKSGGIIKVPKLSSSFSSFGVLAFRNVQPFSLADVRDAPSVLPGDVRSIIVNSRAERIEKLNLVVQAGDFLKEYTSKLSSVERAMCGFDCRFAEDFPFRNHLVVGTWGWDRNALRVRNVDQFNTIYELEDAESMLSPRFNSGTLEGDKPDVIESFAFSITTNEGNYVFFTPKKMESYKKRKDLLVQGETSFQVTILEGWSSYQIVEKLQSVEELAGEAVRIPAEGSLAPNTYAISKGDSVEIVMARMMREQQRILDEAWENRAEGLPYKTKEEALIMASIIEKETGVKSERRDVAAAFVNRLNKGMRLQTDSTVIYGLTLGKAPLGRGLRRSELAKETPYNTYVISGLPPTPIGNPGKESIEAALNPAKSDNLYFVADGSGGHVFSRTLAEHNRNVAKWRRIEAEKNKEVAE